MDDNSKIIIIILILIINVYSLIIYKFNNETNNSKTEMQLLKDTTDIYKEFLLLYIENKEMFYFYKIF